MTPDMISLTIIGIFIFILLVGFLVGLFRGLNKGLTRILLVVAMLVLSFFITPVITKAVMTIDITGLGINVAGSRMSTFPEIIRTLLNQIPNVSDITGTAAYATIMEVVPQMVLNVVLFVVIFYLLRLISLIIYWIIAGVCFNKKKMEGKNAHRFIGSLIGVVQNFIIFLVLLVPVIGVVNIMGELENISSDTNAEQTTPTSYVSADDEYVVTLEDDNSSEEAIVVVAEEGNSSNSTVVSAYKKVNEVIDIYKNTWVSKFLNKLQLEKACNSVFDKLSTVEKDNVKYTLKTEVISAGKVYRDIDNMQKNGGFDISKPAAIDSIQKIIEDCYESKLTTNLIDEVVPLAIKTWNEVDDEGNPKKFLGISKPTVEGYETVIDKLLNKLGGTRESKKAILMSTTSMIKSILKTADTINKPTYTTTIGDNTIYVKVSNDKLMYIKGTLPENYTVEEGSKLILDANKAYLQKDNFELTEVTQDNVDMASVGELLQELVSNDDVLELAQDVIVDKIGDITEQVLPIAEDATDEEATQTQQYRDMISQTVTEIFTANYEELDTTIQDEVKVVQTTLEIADKLKDEEQTITESDAEKLVNDLNGSSVVLDYLAKDDSAVTDKIQETLSEADKAKFADAISALGDDNPNKLALEKIFGINA